MTKKYMVCTLLFVVLLFGGWVLNRHIDQLTVKHGDVSGYGTDVQLLDDSRFGWDGQWIVPVEPFRPREYVRIIRIPLKIDPHDQL